MAEIINSTPEQKKENRALMSALGAIVIVVAALAIIGFLFLNKPPQIIEGQAEATSVKISGKLPGRVMKFYVNEGDMVKAGDTLVHIHSSLVEARLQQVKSMENVAQATNNKVDAGTRKQLIQGAYELWQQANAAVTITKKTYDRIENLYRNGVMSEQKRDEAKAAYDAATAAAAAAKSQYEMAKQGAQKEDKQAAAALVGAAAAGVSEVEAVLEDQYLIAPCDGQVDVIFPNEGELVALGAPIMNVLKVADKWITFNVRESNLNDFKQGSDVTVVIPALGSKEVKAKVFYVRDMGSYATWHATKTTGDWDSKTFEVKVRPNEQLADLRPGMTVLYRK